MRNPRSSPSFPLSFLPATSLIYCRGDPHTKKNRPTPSRSSTQPRQGVAQSCYVPSLTQFVVLSAGWPGRARVAQIAHARSCLPCRQHQKTRTRSLGGRPFLTGGKTCSKSELDAVLQRQLISFFNLITPFLPPYNCAPSVLGGKLLGTSVGTLFFIGKKGHEKP